MTSNCTIVAVNVPQEMNVAVNVHQEMNVAVNVHQEINLINNLHTVHNSYVYFGAAGQCALLRSL